MTDRLPRVSASEAVRVLEKAGYFLVRQSGSHRVYKDADGRRPRCLIIPAKSFTPRF